ncbi:MAG: PAS sensor protein [Candidatus Riflebacteria bacterium]|nr:PAS sensor protein [Candidatus Riflebacteria bacterium]
MAVTVCNIEGIIIAMNPRAGETFERDGGLRLIGKSLYDCHPPRASELIRALIRENRSKTYTIEKKGMKKLIHQTPWIRDGKVAGLVEFSIVLPDQMPHFVRGA